MGACQGCCLHCLWRLGAPEGADGSAAAPREAPRLVAWQEVGGGGSGEENKALRALGSRGN